MDEERLQKMRTENDPRLKGKCAEDVANWYFRLNGFLSIPSFIVHIDQENAYKTRDGSPRYARTETDIMGVRFSNSGEILNGRKMTDDPILTKLAKVGRESQTLFVLVEVKASECKVNGPWTNSDAKNMQRVIRRLGFAIDEQDAEDIAKDMYKNLRWEDDCYVLQYICVGKNKDADLNRQFRNLVQINWQEIASFLLRRFQEFPEKLPNGHIHEQWTDFGKEYADWFLHQKRNNRNSLTDQESLNAIIKYIKTGNCIDNQTGANR